LAAVDDLSLAIVQAATPYGGHRVLALAAEIALAQQFGVSRREVEEAALLAGVVPLRYLRNIGTIGLEGQLALLRAAVAVVGLGGLGGYVVEGLARVGVGRLIVVDGDRFEEHNLNRQLLSLEAVLGRPKAEVAKERVLLVNGAVSVEAHFCRLDEENGPAILGDAAVVVDALDNLPDRLRLQTLAARLGKPLVHGAIAGFLGQVTTIFPGAPGLAALYGENPALERGMEELLGTPPATPMLVAALEVQETVKLITGKGRPLSNALLLLDTESGEAHRLQLL